MRAFCFTIALALVFSTESHADSSTTAVRDAALKGVNACLRRNEASSRECKNFNKNLATLEDVYWQGDKTVLPVLLRFTYLTDFLGQSLIADPDTFLTAVSRLPEQAQQSVAEGIAGRFGLTRSKFDAIRKTLMNVPESSPMYQLARKNLMTLETMNASLLVEYFPPQTFTADPRNLLVRWYSQVLYAADEKPVAHIANDRNNEVYRMMILPTWGNPIIMRIQRHDELYSLSARRLDGQAGYYPGKLVEAKDIDLSPDDSRMVDALIQNLDFFQIPTDDTVRGFDGDEWILEGVSQGNYHLVQRWCPEFYDPGKRKLTAFLGLGRFLIDKSTLSERPANKGHKLI